MNPHIVTPHSHPVFNPDDFTHITEGKATILFPKGNEVFYNPIQQFNRDLSITAIKAWSEEWIGKKKEKHEIQKRNKEKRAAKEAEAKTEDAEMKEATEVKETKEAGEYNPKFTILEALSASGLRALRYAHEIPNVHSVTANDFSAEAVESIRRNAAHNNLLDIVKPTEGDARAAMYSNSKAFTVVDLDPYGTAAPFIDGAVQSVQDDGLLCITCTDLAVLAGGGYPEKCYANYGGMPVKGVYTHEAALRLVLNTVAISAARYGRAIEPLLSLSIDFYIRMFIRVRSSPVNVKHLPSQTMLTWTCSGCGSHTSQPLGRSSPGKTEKAPLKHHVAQGPSVGPNCEHCGFKQHLGGPMWSGPLHNPEFVKRVIKIAEKSDETVYHTKKRIIGMCTVASEEVEAPFYITPQALASKVHSETIPLKMAISALLNAGYEVSNSHALGGSFKTNAPYSFLWDMMRAWIKKHPLRGEPGANTVAAGILARREPNVEIDFSPNTQARMGGRRDGLVRYQENPREHWGPMAKAGAPKATDKKRKRGSSEEQKTEEQKTEEQKTEEQKTEEQKTEEA